MSLAERFSKIFAGLDRAYGYYYTPSGARANGEGKVLGRRATVSEPVTVELWEKHLAGEGGFGLGIVPVRDDARAAFGAIDVDVYPLDLPKLEKRVRLLELPLTVARTKSGGAHLYLFLRPAASAEKVRARLVEWATLLGYPGVEVFPKQTRLAGPDDDLGESTGNWINVPYGGGRPSVRYALKSDGSAMSAEEFADHAERVTATEADLDAVDAPLDDWFEDAPPCLPALGIVGFGDWQNNGLYNIAVYLKKRFGTAVRLDEYNRRFMEPPASARDVASIVKSVGKKKYSYKCKDQPICAVCDRATCVTRKHGVRGDAGDVGVAIGSLTKLSTVPPTWILEINAKRVKVSTKQLLNQALMRDTVLEELDVQMKLIPSEDWANLVDERLKKLERVEVPEDATPDGQLVGRLAKWCTSRAAGKALDDILRGVPFTDEEAGRTYFVAADFLAYLAQHRVNGVDERELYTVLRSRDLEAHQKKIKGKPVAYWSVPAFARQTEDHDVPRAPAPGRM